MKARVPVILAVAAVALLAGGRDGAAQSVAEQVLTGCEAEVRDHCSEVTPGEGRLLACLYAHGDKLSGRCEFALYDAAARLERAVSALTYVASECRADIQERCAGVRAGEGRILQCLEGAGDKLSAACIRALTDVGLRR
jgi:Cysteine rich repeat